MAFTYAVCDKCKKLNRVALNENRTPVCGSCKAELPVHGAVIEGQDSSLQILMQKSPVPIVLDVWAPWCGPCRSFAPTFEELSRQYAGQFVFVKLNSDQNRQSAGRLGIRSIPTLLIFKKGQEISRQSGALPRDHFSHWLDQNK